MLVATGCDHIIPAENGTTVFCGGLHSQKFAPAGLPAGYIIACVEFQQFSVGALYAFAVLAFT